MDTPVTRISDPREAVEAVISGKERYLFLKGTKVKPENWRYQLVIRNDDIQVYAVRIDGSQQVIGYVNQEVLANLLELAKERLTKMRKEVDQRLEMLDTLEEMMDKENNPAVNAIRRAKTRFLAMRTLLQDLLPTTD